MSRRFDTDISCNRPFNSLYRTNGFHICSNLLFEFTFLRLSGSVVPSSRKLKMLTQTSKHFSNSCISYSSYEGHSCWSSWFCRYCHQASYKLLVLVSKFDKCPFCSAKQRTIPKLSSYHLPLLLLTSARRFLFCVMNSGTWTLQGNKCCRVVITPF